jgi:hypothetical protein
VKQETKQEDPRAKVEEIELGGQVRKSVERLSPSRGQSTTRILVDGKPVEVRASPGKTLYLGVVPSNVSTAAAEAQLAGKEKINYRSLKMGGSATQVKGAAAQMAQEGQPGKAWQIRPRGAKNPKQPKKPAGSTQAAAQANPAAPSKPAQKTPPQTTAPSQKAAPKPPAVGRKLGSLPRKGSLGLGHAATDVPGGQGDAVSRIKSHMTDVDDAPDGQAGKGSKKTSGRLRLKNLKVKGKSLIPVAISIGGSLLASEALAAGPEARMAQLNQAAFSQDTSGLDERIGNLISAKEYDFVKLQVDKPGVSVFANVTITVTTRKHVIIMGEDVEESEDYMGTSVDVKLSHDDVSKVTSRTDGRGMDRDEHEITTYSVPLGTTEFEELLAQAHARGLLTKNRMVKLRDYANKQSLANPGRGFANRFSYWTELGHVLDVELDETRKKEEAQERKRKEEKLKELQAQARAEAQPPAPQSSGLPTLTSFEQPRSPYTVSLGGLDVDTSIKDDERADLIALKFQKDQAKWIAANIRDKDYSDKQLKKVKARRDGWVQTLGGYVALMRKRPGMRGGVEKLEAIQEWLAPGNEGYFVLMFDREP